MAPDCLERARHRGSIKQLLSNQHWGNEVRDNVPGRIGGLGIVRGSFHGRDFSPPTDPVRDHFHEKNAAILSDAEAGLKWRLQAHVDLSQGEALNSHRRPPMGETDSWKRATPVCGSSLLVGPGENSVKK